MKIEIKKVGKNWEVNGKCATTLQGKEKAVFEDILKIINNQNFNQNE
jgi:hypothetical protein